MHLLIQTSIIYLSQHSTINLLSINRSSHPFTHHPSVRKCIHLFYLRIHCLFMLSSKIYPSIRPSIIMYPSFTCPNNDPSSILFFISIHLTIIHSYFILPFIHSFIASLPIINYPIHYYVLILHLPVQQSIIITPLLLTNLYLCPFMNSLSIDPINLSLHSSIHQWLHPPNHHLSVLLILPSSKPSRKEPDLLMVRLFSSSDMHEFLSLPSPQGSKGASWLVRLLLRTPVKLIWAAEVGLEAF